MSQEDVVEVDFEVLRENWTKYKLITDNSLLRVRIAILKIFQTGIGEVGLPNFGIAAQNIVSVLVPKELLKKQGEVPVQSEPIRPEHIKEGTDIDFESIGSGQWQEYKTVDGWIVMIKPEVGKVVRLKSYTLMGQTKLLEPTYWANIQTVFRLKKA